jgi:serine/threonine protein kinase
MGAVYQARDSRLGRDVAIKVVAADSIDALQVRERFEREARSVAGLHHPNICTVYDVGDAYAYSMKNRSRSVVRCRSSYARAALSIASCRWPVAP